MHTRALLRVDSIPRPFVHTNPLNDVLGICPHAHRYVEGAYPAGQGEVHTGSSETDLFSEAVVAVHELKSPSIAFSIARLP